MFESLPLSRDILPLLRAPSALRRLNIGAVAASLAACTGAVGVLLNHGSAGLSTFDDAPAPAAVSSAFTSVACACALSTFVYAVVWGWILRRRSTTPVLRWLACVPLAAMNAGTALALCMTRNFTLDEALLTSLAGGFIAGATFGALVWVPALFATLLCFGLPLHLADVAARKGLSSEDRGERMVAIFATLLAVAALAVCTYLGTGSERIVLSGLSAIAVATGTTAAAIAHARSRKRDRFLSEVRAGEHQGLAFVDACGGENLVRVACVGAAYRESRVAEPLLEVQYGGDVKATALLQHHFR